MIVTANQIKGKPKKVAKVGTQDVFHTITKGGLHILSLVNGGKKETISTGPHVGVARHIAMKSHPTMEWTSLNKSDWVDLDHCESLLPKYENLTSALRKREGSDK